MALFPVGHGLALSPGTHTPSREYGSEGMGEPQKGECQTLQLPFPPTLSLFYNL